MLITIILVLILVLALFGDPPLKIASPWVNVFVAITAFVLLLLSLLGRA